jgi:hypothetical protein
MRFRAWFIGFVGASLIVASVALIGLLTSGYPYLLAEVVLGVWILACGYKLAEALITRVEVVGGHLVYRDWLFRTRKVATSEIGKLRYSAGRRLEVSMDDGSRLRIDPRVMTGVPDFIERLSADVTQHRSLLVSGDLE